MKSRVWTVLALAAMAASAREIHVSVKGSDSGDGSAASPLRTISAAARMAQPGDSVTVHTGTYRERVTPPRGGESEARRIVYQAAAGERVEVKGSEVVTGWTAFQPGVWKAVVPNTLFGKYNPYKDVINGDWFTDKGRVHHTGEVYVNGQPLWETHLLENVLKPKAGEGPAGAWFAEVDGENTYIYANFLGKDPGAEVVEINVRDAVFYPERPGVNYITVRGFHMMHAATQWAAPTAEQVGLIGTHMGKGWIIEDNVISDSRCACVSLGKDRATGHNVWNADPRKDGATHYNEVILRALAAGWSRETTGGHVVRGNDISRCEQGGIVGSLGAVFSVIENNHIHDVWVRRQFTGAEMGGIKLHGAIDVVIRHNRIHNTGRGLWMDWMAQGTRITGNLLYDNSTDDLFVEVNHGPFLVDNNVMLSPLNLRDWSEGGAYAHNLFAGRIDSRTEPRRSTPFHKPHSTVVAGLMSIEGGDNRFFNNVFVGAQTAEAADPLRYGGYGLWVYNHRSQPLMTGGNVYVNGARPYVNEEAVKLPGARPALAEQGGTVVLNWPVEFTPHGTKLVTTELLGKAKTPGLRYENADGTALRVDRDYAGKVRNANAPRPGPFEEFQAETRVW